MPIRRQTSLAKDFQKQISFCICDHPDEHDHQCPDERCKLSAQLRPGCSPPKTRIAVAFLNLIVPADQGYYD
jgi:hypothetical protein